MINCAKSQCGGGLIQRDDDTEAIVKARLDIYNKQTSPLTAYYTQQGMQFNLDHFVPRYARTRLTGNIFSHFCVLYRASTSRVTGLLKTFNIKKGMGDLPELVKVFESLKSTAKSSSKL
jgi:hypothetical protein